MEKKGWKKQPLLCWGEGGIVGAVAPSSDAIEGESELLCHFVVPEGLSKPDKNNNNLIDVKAFW